MSSLRENRESNTKCAWRIQEMVDETPKADKYCSDGYLGYSDVDYYGAKYVRNCHNKYGRIHRGIQCLRRVENETSLTCNASSWQC